MKVYEIIRIDSNNAAYDNYLKKETDLFIKKLNLRDYFETMG